MATSKEELQTNRSVPQPGLTPDEPERVIDHGTTDAPRHSDEDGSVLSRFWDRLFRR